jgi:hypothetical protein
MPNVNIPSPTRLNHRIGIRSFEWPPISRVNEWRHDALTSTSSSPCLPIRSPAVGENQRIDPLTAVDAAPTGHLTPIQHDGLETVAVHRHHESVTTGARPLLFRNRTHVPLRRFMAFIRRGHSSFDGNSALCIVTCTVMKSLDPPLLGEGLV